MAVTPNLRISDLALVKPKRGGSFFEKIVNKHLKNVNKFSKNCSILIAFGFANVRSEIHSFRVTAI